MERCGARPQRFRIGRLFSHQIDLRDFQEHHTRGEKGYAVPKADFECDADGNGLQLISLYDLAERAGFEPAIRFPVYTLSRRAPSTTRPPLRGACHGRVEEFLQATAADFPQNAENIQIDGLARPKGRHCAEKNGVSAGRCWRF